MSWVTIIWSMTAAACLTLALLHGLIWAQTRKARANLMFALSAVGTALMAGCELWCMRAQSPEEIGIAIRWLQVASWLIILPLLGFVRLYLRAGRLWLAWTIIALRTVAVVLTFVFTPNINFREISALKRVPFLGEMVSVAVGVPNPWMIIAQLGLVLLLIFLIDATVTVWKRGNRRHALTVGVTTIFFVGASIVQVVPITWGIVNWPMTFSLFYMGVVAAMAYELSGDLLRAARLAEDLRESEERMDLAAGAADLGIWTWDIVRDEIWCSERGRKLFGFAESERLNFDRFLKALHPDDRVNVSQDAARAMDGEGDFESECRVVLPDGRIEWVGTRGRVEFDKGGKPMRMRSVSIHISERKRAEEKFRMAVEASLNAIVMIDQHGKIILANALTEKLFGYRREELIGQSVERLVPERFRASHSEQRGGFFASPQHRAVGGGLNLSARRKDGSEFPVEIGLNPIQTSEGVLVLASIVDITERRRSEIELHRHRQELAHVSRVSVMGELSASMAHELNQPLTAILSNAQAAQRFLAGDQPDMGEFREILKDIVYDTTRARDVIRHLRSLVKKSEREQVRLGVNETIQQVIGFLHGDIVGRNINVELELTPDLPTVLGDRVQLQQVLLNLLLNAFEAVHGNKVADRHVTVSASLDSPTSVRVAVRDTGAGIPSDVARNIFEPFFTTKPSGLGMGLSVSRSIIESHAGDLRGENNLDCGATFFFTLPVGE